MNESDIRLISHVNPMVKRLSVRRVDRIDVEGMFAQSKLAWKIATYAQGVLYRLVMLANGCALNWNAGNYLCAILAARALLETTVLVWDCEREVRRCLDSEDIAGLDSLATKLSFATRNPEWLPSFPDSRAVNIMTLIEKFERQEGMTGLVQEYQRLSERCHPNSEGHLFFFGTLETTTGTYTYSDAKRYSISLHSVLTAALLTGFAENALDQLEEAIAKIADLQHQKNPVGSGENA